MENAAHSGVKPSRVLVVEDEMLVAMFLEDVLADLGYEVAGVVSHVDAALSRAAAGDFDFAILDVHLNGKDVFPLADLLASKQIPWRARHTGRPSRTPRPAKAFPPRRSRESAEKSALADHAAPGVASAMSCRRIG